MCPCSSFYLLNFCRVAFPSDSASLPDYDGRLEVARFQRSSLKIIVAVSFRCWTFGVRRWIFASPGRVAESGLRHSTRNRAWGNPPWVRIPPLPPRSYTSNLDLFAVFPFGLSLNRNHVNCADVQHASQSESRSA